MAKQADILDDQVPPAARAVEEQVAGEPGKPYVGRFPTAYHPHGDYSAGELERDAGAGRFAPTPDTAMVPAVKGPNKPAVKLDNEKINKGHGSKNRLVDGTDE